MVTATITIVKQRDSARAAFWLHLTRICQMSLTGMYKTGSPVNCSFPQRQDWRVKDLLSKSPMMSKIICDKA